VVAEMPDADPRLPVLSLTIGRREMLVDGKDHVFRQMLHDMLSVGEYLRLIRESFASFIDISGPQYTTLAAIRQYCGVRPVGVAELAAHLHLSGAFITGVTNNLAGLGLINKVANPVDQRRVDLTLTDRGAKALLLLAPMQRGVNDALFMGVSADEFATLCRVMRVLEANGASAISLAENMRHPIGKTSR
jgi:DNA-binding MarR family transcriptional regulator